MPDLPDELSQFIVDSIDTVGHLEALLLLQRNPGHEWSSEAVAARLYVNIEDATQILSVLAHRQLVARTGAGYRYQPLPRHDGLVRDLQKVYSTHLIQITKIIHAKPRSRVHEFAEAFKLKRGK